MVRKATTLKGHSSRIYDAVMLGNPGFRFHKVLEEEFHNLAERNELTLKAGKKVISEYIIPFVQEYGKRHGISGASLVQIYRLVLNQIFGDYKTTITDIQKIYSRHWREI